MARRLIGFWFIALSILTAAACVKAQALDTLKIKAEADSLLNIGNILRREWKLDDAMVYFQMSLEKYNMAGLMEESTEPLHWIGQIYLYQSNYNEALKTWEEKLAIHKRTGHKVGISATYIDIGIIYLNQSDFQKAIEYFNMSLKLSKEIQNNEWICRNLFSLGSVYSQLSDHQKALQYFNECLKISKENGISYGAMMALGGIGAVYKDLYDYQKALEYYLECLDLMKQVDDQPNIAAVLGNIGEVYALLGKYDEAQEYFLQDLNICKDLGNPKGEAETLQNIAVSYIENKRYDEAQKCLDNCMEILKSSEDPLPIMMALAVKGELYKSLQHYSSALEFIMEALDIAKKLDMAEELKEIYHQLGSLYGIQGQDSLAIVYFDLAISTAEKIRSNIAVTSSKSSYSAGVSYLYEEIMMATLRQNRFEKAFHYTERAKARSFLDLLASGQVKVGKPNHQDFLAKDSERQKQQQLLDEQIAQAGEDTVQIQALRGKLSQEWETALTAIEQTRKNEPELASLVSVDALTLPEVQKLLDKNSALLEYFLTKEKTLLWVVTRNNAEVFQINIGGDSLKSLVMAYRKAIEKGADVTDQSQQLYKLLIAPAQDKIRSDNLIIVPHGILHYLPYGALQNPKGDYLIDKYQISYLPSASVLKYLAPKRRPRGEKILALGNPATDRKGFDPIPMTEAEVNGIGRLYRHSRVLTGPRATEEEFRKLAPDYDVLHLACHGDLNAAYPLFSCLLLTPDSAQDGELGVHEIFNMDLNASLVVLSGCQTGLGHLTNGDEVVGLSRAFIYAGTPSIVSSLWMVEDQSTAYLMERFYQHLRNKNKAEALRLAQLDTRKRYPAARSWASFVLIGDSM